MFCKKPTLPQRGFTLLEMMLVLFILLIIAGIAIPVTSSLFAQERLKAQARKLQDYAASARKLAVTEGHPYEIVLNARGFSLERMPEGEKKNDDVVDTVRLRPNVGYSVEHWGAEEFGKPAGESWVFQPDGICEPLRVHFESGNGWIEFTFNPLTAGPQDESYHFQ